MNFVVPAGCSGGDQLNVVVGGNVVSFLIPDGLVEGNEFGIDAKWLQAKAVEGARQNPAFLVESEMEVHLLSRIIRNENYNLEQSPTTDKPPLLPPRDPATEESTAADLESG